MAEVCDLRALNLVYGKRIYWAVPVTARMAPTAGDNWDHFLETANSRYVADPRPTALHELGVSQTVANNRVHCAAPQQATRPQISAFYPFVYSVPCLGPNRIRSFGTEAQSLRVEKIFFFNFRRYNSKKVKCAIFLLEFRRGAHLPS